ncbi:GDP-perosamine synthase [Flavobacterium ammoniigenes]|uniref:GDP-perosamine synthase n=1 Tax=Flavobacterium ammoniigenes TaxID=1751095 RepID=A0ABM7V5A5_9FLAO|nr:DegT/DnrJ/EryC1/StrS family aminotransferase [Flavobacterium ammoniigenes]BDB54711.1 GDP-perosamine synthase [Flavobacterium ammoniigenes]
MNRISNLEKKYVLEALENEFATSKNGIFTNRMESKFSEIFENEFSISHVNGTATMHTALHALGLKEGDEVIVPPLTMSSTSLCVLQNGSIPIFADVDINTFNIDPKSIRENITEKTKAIITVSLYGLSPEYDEIIQICEEYNLFLIEDNAECFLGYYKGKLVGTFGDFSSYSFQASKHISCGEGGMLTTKNVEYADVARRFTSLGYAGVSAKQAKITRNDIQDPNYSRHVSVGYNYRMSEVQSAVILGQLERIQELVNVRIEVAKLFDDAIQGSKLVTKQYTPDYCINSYWSYSMVLNTDNPNIDWYRFRDLFQKNGGDGFYAAWKLTYMEPLFLNEIQEYPGVYQKYEKGLCPNSEFLQERMIQLKTNYWDLSEAKIQAEILKKTLNEFEL